MGQIHADAYSEFINYFFISIEFELLEKSHEDIMYFITNVFLDWSGYF